MSKKRILSSQALMRKELRISDFKYRLYRISYFGLVGGLTLMMIIVILSWLNKLYWETFFKSFFVLSIIIIICGSYFIIYYSRLEKWYREYERERMAERERQKTLKDIKDGKYPKLKIVEGR